MVRAMRLDGAARKRLANAVADAEKRTSGEIVVVLHRRAGRYAGTMAFVSLATVALLYAAGNYKTFALATRSPQWQVSPSSWMAPLPTLLIWVTGFIAAWLSLEWLPMLLRPFVGKDRMGREAFHGAWRAFGERAVYTTAGRTGVLIYVAEFERTVIVRGDTRISSLVTDQDWEPIRDTVLNGYRVNKPLDALVAAVQMAGELLAKHLPCAKDDVDELPDDPTTER